MSQKNISLGNATEEDVIDAFIRVFYRVGRGECQGFLEEDIRSVAGSVYEYNAVTHCFSGDTSIMNDKLNLYLDGYEELSQAGFPRV